MTSDVSSCDVSQATHPILNAAVMYLKRHTPSSILRFSSCVPGRARVLCRYFSCSVSCLHSNAREIILRSCTYKCNVDTCAIVYYAPQSVLFNAGLWFVLFNAGLWFVVTTLPFGFVPRLSCIARHASHVIESACILHAAVVGVTKVTVTFQLHVYSRGCRHTRARTHKHKHRHTQTNTQTQTHTHKHTQAYKKTHTRT